MSAWGSLGQTASEGATFKKVEQDSRDRTGRADDASLTPAIGGGVGRTAIGGGVGRTAIGGGVGQPADLRQLQTVVGNRAMRQVLARLAPADTKLAESESVIQPPMMWIKYPPAIPMMTRVELFDAIALLNEWLPKHDYRAELKALREDLRKAGHQITTPVEYSTFSHWAKLPKSRIRAAYDKEIERVIADRNELGAVSFDAIDEVVRDRFPNEQWPAVARAWLNGHLREEDRREERFAKLPWYERDTFEQFEEMSRKLDGAGHDLYRELAWQWIDLRDAGKDRTTIEDQLIHGLAGLYEHLLHEVDDLIQKECAKHHPEGWRERIQENLYKAWGDPCKPWFGPEGTHGPDELTFFKLKLRLQRAGTPFSVVYWWVKEYLNFEALLTDPKAQLAQMQRQAMVGLFVHWATVLEFTPEIYAQVRGLGQWISRTGSNFLRNTMLGYRLALGDLGGSGAEVGGLGTRPSVTAVSGPTGGGGARPPVPRTIDMPDPPATTTTTTAPGTRTTAPTTTPTTTGTSPTTTTPATPARLPPSTASNWHVPSNQTPSRPDPPPSFTKARDLHIPQADNGPRTRETVKRAVLDKFKKNNLKSGTAEADLPSGWKKMFDQLRNALAQNTDSASRQVLEVLEIVWAALRDPELWAEVIASAWERAIAGGTSIDAALISMAEESSGEKATWIPRHLAQWLLDNPGAFFDLYASQPRPFVDMPLMGNEHRGLSHLLQDLVVNLGLRRAKKNITSFQVRRLLVHIPGKIVPARTPGGPTIDTGGPPDMRIGDFAWQLTYDLNQPGWKHFPQPEAVAQALHELLNLQ